MTLDPGDPEGAIAEAAAKHSNWGRWGDDDVLGTLNFLDAAKRREGAALVRQGVSFSLSQRFDAQGPQQGWRRRVNPVHTMLDTGTDAALGNQGFPHGIGGADDMVTMPLQCSTQWDGLGHIGREQHVQLLPSPAREHRGVQHGAGAGRRGRLAPAPVRLQPA